MKTCTAIQKWFSILQSRNHDVSTQLQTLTKKNYTNIENNKKIWLISIISRLDLAHLLVKLIKEKKIFYGKRASEDEMRAERKKQGYPRCKVNLPMNNISYGIRARRK